MNNETDVFQNLASTYPNGTLIVIGLVFTLGVMLIAAGVTMHLIKGEMRSMTNRQFRRWKSK